MKIKIVLFAVIISFSTAFSQEKVYMPFIELMNIHSDYQYSLSKLFKTYVNEQGKYDIILPQKWDSLYPTESFEQTKKTAQSLSAPYFIIAEMNRVGEVVIVSFAIYNSTDGNKVWNDMLKAQTPDDLDPIIMKMARSIGTDTKSSQDGDIYSVTQYESDELKKINASFLLGVSVGGAYPFITKVSNPFAAGFGFIASYDVRNFIFDIKGQAYFGDVDIYYLDLETLYPFKYKKNTPFVSAGLGFGGVHILTLTEKPYNEWGYDYSFKERDGGLMLFAGGGYILNRIANVNLRLGANLFFPLFEVNSIYPAGVKFDMAILFNR